jgi:hypothetical protein
VFTHFKLLAEWWSPYLFLIVCDGADMGLTASYLVHLTADAFQW